MGADGRPDNCMADQRIANRVRPIFGQRRLRSSDHDGFLAFEFMNNPDKCVAFYDIFEQVGYVGAGQGLCNYAQFPFALLDRNVWSYRGVWLNLICIPVHTLLSCFGLPGLLVGWLGQDA